MLRKPKKSTQDTLFDKTETKLLISSSKPRIHEKFPKSTRENNRQKSKFLLISIIL